MPLGGGGGIGGPLGGGIGGGPSLGGMHVGPGHPFFADRMRHPDLMPGPSGGFGAGRGAHPPGARWDPISERAPFPRALGGRATRWRGAAPRFFLNTLPTRPLAHFNPPAALV